MSKYPFRSSAPDPWTLPRPTRDRARAREINGPLLPMEPERKPRRGILSWLW